MRLCLLASSVSRRRQGVAGHRSRPFPSEEGIKRALPPCRGGRSAEEGSSPRRGEESIREKAPPLAGRKDWMRRLGIAPKSQRRPTSGMLILRGDPLSPPGNSHGGRTAETCCVGKQRASLHATCAGNADETGWSRPIGIVCPTDMIDNVAHSFAGLRHRPKPCDIYLACASPTVVSA
jgi:hypothetical protein